MDPIFVPRPPADSTYPWHVSRCLERAALPLKPVVGVAIVVVATFLAATAAATLRPPYLTQAKPLYGGVTINVQDGKVWTYRGDWVLAVFDYAGEAKVKTLPYTVCRVAGARRLCVRRVWRGRPDVWMIRVLEWVGASRYVDFQWSVGGKLRRTARVWIYE